MTFPFIHRLSVSPFWKWAVFIALLSFVVFSPILRNGFVNLDDNVNVYENPWFVVGESDAYQRFWRGTYEGLFIPVTYSVWWTISRFTGAPLVQGDGKIAPISAFPYHLLNLTVHALNALLVFALLRLLLQVWNARQAKPADTGHKIHLAAGLGALMWGLHPVQVEPVAWVTGFKDVFSGFLALASLLAYLGFARSVSEGSASKRFSLALSLVLYGLAILSKPSTIVLPLLAFLLEAGILGTAWRRSAIRTLPALLPAGLIVSTAQGVQDLPDYAFSPIWGRPLVAADALTFYLGKLAFPYPLCMDYGRVPNWVIAQPLSFLYLILQLILIVSLWALWKKRRLLWPLLAYGVFFIASLPVQGWVPFVFQLNSTVTDRYLYLPLLGPAILVAFLALRFRPFRLAMLPWFVVVVVINQGQISHWKGTKQLCDHTLAVNPESLWLGGLEATELATAGNLNAAAVQAEKILLANPQAAYAPPEGWENINQAQYAMGELLLKVCRRQNRTPYYLTVLGKKSRQMPHSADISSLMAQGLYAAGRKDEAMLLLAQVVQRRPEHVATLTDLAGNLIEAKQFSQAAKLLEGAQSLTNSTGQIPYALGTARQGLGDEAGALEAYTVALENAPTRIDLVNAAAPLALRLNQPEWALRLYRRAVRLQPSSGVAKANLGDALLQLKKYPEAVKVLQAAVNMSPHLPAIRLRLGQALMADSRPTEAVEVFRSLIALAPDHPASHAELAYALEASGNSAAALAQWRMVVRLQPNSSDAQRELKRLKSALSRGQ